MPCALCRVHAAGSSQGNLYGNATATKTMCISLKTNASVTVPGQCNHGSRGKCVCVCVCVRERERGFQFRL